MAFHIRKRTLVRPMLMFLAAAAGFAFASQSDQKEGEQALAQWIYPKATAAEVMHSTSPGASVRFDTGQYSTDDPFHEVVRFYVEKSGVEPPNWSILGRKFPGDTINIPGSWTKWGKAEVVTVHHHIRPDSAGAGLLKTDFASGETVSVTISRGLKDKKTFIRVIRHAQK
jgi:hypothetical protein